MKWISIEKTPPPFDIPILVFDEVDLVCVAFYQRFNLEFRSTLFTDYKLEYVTHWQLCPLYPVNEETSEDYECEGTQEDNCCSHFSDCPVCDEPEEEEVKPE